jgi:hypothetical protein
LMKLISPVVEIRKYYCVYCKKTYYIFMGSDTKKVAHQD